MPPQPSKIATTADTTPLYLDVRPCTSIPYLVLSTTSAISSSPPPLLDDADDVEGNTSSLPLSKLDASSSAPSSRTVCETDDDVSTVLEALITDADEPQRDGEDTRSSSILVDRSVVVSNRRVKLRIVPKLLLSPSTSPNTTAAHPQMVALTVRSSAPSQWTIKQSSVVIPVGTAHEVVVSLRKTLRRYELRSNLLITARVVRDAEVGAPLEESIRRGSTWRSQNVELDPKGPQVETNTTPLPSPFTTTTTPQSSPSDVIHMVVPCIVRTVAATPMLYDRLLLQYHKHQRNAPLDAADGSDEGGRNVTADPAVEMNFSNLLLGGESEDSPSLERSPQSGGTSNPQPSQKVNLMRLVDRFVTVSKSAEKARYRLLVPAVDEKRKSVEVVTAIANQPSNAKATTGTNNNGAHTPTATTPPILTSTSDLDITPLELDTLVATLEGRLLQINTMIDAANKEIHDILHTNSSSTTVSGSSKGCGTTRNPSTITTATAKTTKIGKVLGCLRYVEGALFNPPRAVWGWASQYNWAPMGITLISLMLTWLIGITVASGRY